MAPTRREALRALAAGLLTACRGSHGEPNASATAAPPAPRSTADETGDVPHLSVIEVGGAAHGDAAVILLHGWRASGDDLVPLARELLRPNTTFFVPAAPLADGSGRAWWHFDPTAPRLYAASDALPSDYRPLAAVTSARRAVQALVREVRARLAPSRVALAGFSQGAMLALDVALECEPHVDRVAMLSGALLFDALPALVAPCAARPRVLVTHGRRDPVVPFPNAEHAVAVLEQHGFSVQFRPFDGRHQIPAEARSALADFLFDA